jgi:hypothetical protein
LDALIVAGRAKIITSVENAQSSTFEADTLVEGAKLELEDIAYRTGSAD